MIYWEIVFFSEDNVVVMVKGVSRGEYSGRDIYLATNCGLDVNPHKTDILLSTSRRVISLYIPY